VNWILVSEKSPEMWLQTLCYCRAAKPPIYSPPFICVGYWGGSSGFGGPEYSHMRDEDGECRVTHWMSLPAPPDSEVAK
jgi:hypothetical protein